MCIQCEMKKARGRAQKVIGTISGGLLADFNAYVKAEMTADLDLQQLVLDARRAHLNGEATEAETETRQEGINAIQDANTEKYEAEHNALWDRIYGELGLEGEAREEGYTINTENGEISLTAPDPLEGLASAISHMFKE